MTESQMVVEIMGLTEGEGVFYYRSNSERLCYIKCGSHRYGTNLLHFIVCLTQRDVLQSNLIYPIAYLFFLPYSVC